VLLFLAIALAAPRHHLLELPRDGQEPLRTMVRWEPHARDAAPRQVIVWSHGLFGSHEAYEPLVRAWVEAGYVVVQPTHDDTLLGLTKEEIQKKMSGPPPLTVWKQRPKDVALVLDALPSLDEQVKGLPDLDLDHVGMGGHSFGAYTAMLVSGVAAERLHLDDPRPEAFVWLSPTGVGGDGEGAFAASEYATVTRPVLFVTGSKDEANVRKQPASWRLTSWEALDAPATLWFVDDAHHNFGGIAGRIIPGTGPADPALVGWVAEATTAFWDHELRGRELGVWFDAEGARERSGGRVKVEAKAAP
jgi:dienelactone hydrolase